MTRSAHPTPHGRRLPPWVPFLVFAVVWIAHAQSLRSGWVLDDRDVVRDSAIVQRGTAGIGEAVATAWEGEADEGAWRPLTVASYCLEARFWRTPGGVLLPFGFHLTNVLLHAVCALLLLAVVGRLAPGRPWLGAGTALVFAVHPIHASTVAALVGRADLLALLFSLGVVLLWSGERLALRPLAAPVFLFALLSKETAIALVPVLVVLDLSRRAGEDRAFRRLAFGYFFLAGALFLYFLRAPALQAPFPASLAEGAEGLGRVVLGFLAPVGLVEDRFLLTAGGAAESLVGIRWAAGVLLVMGGIGLVRLLGARARGPAPFWFAALITGIAGLVGAVFAPAGAVLEIRFAYLTAPALFLWAGLVVEFLAGGTERTALRGTVAGLATALLLVGLGALTWRAEAPRKTDAAWHERQIERYPAHLPLQLRFAERLREAAEADTFLAMTLPVTSARRGELLADAKQRLAEALTWAAAVERRVDLVSPDRWTVEAYRQLGFAALEASQPADALDHLERALALRARLDDGRPPPTSPREIRRRVETWLRLGRAQQGLGEQLKAAESYRRASELAPKDLETLRQAARAMVRARQPEDATLLLQRALELGPSGSVRAEIERELRSLAGAMAAGTSRQLRDAAAAEQRTEYREALGLYEAVLARDPESIPALYAVARLRGVWFGDYRLATEALDAGDRILAARGEGPDGRWGRQFQALRAAIEKQQAEEEAEERRPSDDDDDDDDDDAAADDE